MLRGLLRGVGNLLRRGGKVDEELLDELEEQLILADIGMDVTMELMDALRDDVKRERIKDAGEVRQRLQDAIAEVVSRGGHELQLADDGPTVWLILGVNGTGKTTTIGKLAHRCRRQGRNVLLISGDTYRAAAGEQLKVWADRAGVDLVRQEQGADPAAVVYDGLQAARARDRDLVIVDTAGRLHTKHNLMEELRKIARVLQRELGRPPDESLLVIDATTGQNGLVQAAAFHGIAPLTGLILTKMDGAAKGGIVITIGHQLGLPIKVVGVGEGLDDIEDFDPQQFARDLFG